MHGEASAPRVARCSCMGNPSPAGCVLTSPPMTRRPAALLSVSLLSGALSACATPAPPPPPPASDAAAAVPATAPDPQAPALLPKVPPPHERPAAPTEGTN